MTLNDLKILQEMTDDFSNYDLQDIGFVIIPRLIEHPDDGYAVMAFYGCERSEAIENVYDEWNKLVDKNMAFDPEKAIISGVMDVDEFENDFGQPLLEVEDIFGEIYSYYHDGLMALCNNSDEHKREIIIEILEKMKSDLSEKYLLKR